ncbi:MAG: hypothetical protein ACPLKP_03835 [Microgenomates group bacterium]
MISCEKSRPPFSSDENIEIIKITNYWRERLTSLPPLIKNVIDSAVEKIESALKYPDTQTKDNVLKNGVSFLIALGLYLSSPAYSPENPPQTMAKLIEGLNNFPFKDGNFLGLGDKFPDSCGRTFQIKGIYPPYEKPPKEEGFLIPGTNMWDFPSSHGNNFIPGIYHLLLSTPS